LGFNYLKNIYKKSKNYNVGIQIVKILKIPILKPLENLSYGIILNYW